MSTHKHTPGPWKFGKEWLEAQAQAAEYRRLTAELNAYANPTPANKAAAQKVRETLAEKRHERTKEAE